MCKSGARVHPADMRKSPNLKRLKLIAIMLSVLQAEARQTVYKPNDFLIASKLANVNLLEVVHALEQDHLVHKVAGYADTLARSAAADGPKAGSLSAAIAQQENARTNGLARSSQEVRVIRRR